MPYTNINPDFTVDQKNEIITGITQLMEAMNFLVLLTKKEKMRYLKLGKNTLPFFDRTRMLAMSNPEILTSVFSTTDVESKIELWKYLAEIKTQSNKLNEAVCDTFIAVEQELMRSCLYFYRLSIAAANQSVPGASSIKAELETLLPRTGKKLKKGLVKGKV